MLINYNKVNSFLGLIVHLFIVGIVCFGLFCSDVINLGFEKLKNKSI